MILKDSPGSKNIDSPCMEATLNMKQKKKGERERECKDLMLAREQMHVAVVRPNGLLEEERHTRSSQFYSWRKRKERRTNDGKSIEKM